VTGCHPAGVIVALDMILAARLLAALAYALTYSIKVLDGTVPAAAGPCALFIDPLGRPLSPVSLAGMNRRSRRRGR